MAQLVIRSRSVIPSAIMTTMKRRAPVSRIVNGKNEFLPSSVRRPLSSLASSLSRPSEDSTLVLTDVSSLVAYRVARLAIPRSERQLLELLSIARVEGRRVIVAGAAHTMGAHTLLENGLLIQMKFLNAVEFHPENLTVTAQAGAKWSEVIRVLNYYGRTPRTLQSYCSFTVGGSIGANVHGITSDEALSESLLSLRMLMADGTILPNVTRYGVHSELFRATVGGYGQTGIIISAVFRTEPNHPIQTEVIPISRESGDFIPIYQRLRNDPSIVTKIVRVNVSQMDRCTLYLFRKTSSDSRESVLPFVPVESMPLWKELGYSWIFHRKSFQTIRFAWENFKQCPIDWSNQPERNALLFETAAPLAKLYQPFSLAHIRTPGGLASNAGDGRRRTHQDDTFLLKEYFIPEDQFIQWWKEMQAKVTQAEGSLRADGVHLLNITLRSVHENDDSILSYSPIRSVKHSPASNGVSHGNGSSPASSLHYVAAVFYYRLPRDVLAEATLTRLDRELIDLTHKSHGTFYLPYRIAYTREQVLTSYPALPTWFELKKKYDPEGRFLSEWFINLTELVQGKEAAQSLKGRLPPAPAFDSATLTQSSAPKLANQPLYTFRERSFNLFPELIQSFTQLLDHLGAPNYATNAEVADRLETFIKYVLPVESSSERLKSLLSQSSLYFYTRKEREPNSTIAHLDHAVYEKLLKHYNGSTYARLTSQYASLCILFKTRTQIGGELSELLALLPDAGHSIKSVATIGDHGRYIGALISTLSNLRAIHNIHDTDNHWLSRIESGRFLLPANFRRHLIDYNSVAKSLKGSSTLPLTTRFDLVTMTQGLHHLSPGNLDEFLTFVTSRLNPGGYFIIREHDARPGSQVGRLADFAHILFNSSTGVSWKEELAEIRNFQSVDTWKTILEAYGLEDMYLMNRQDTDSTEDYMMMFRKKVTAATEQATEGEPDQSALVKTNGDSSSTTLSSSSTASPSSTDFSPSPVASTVAKSKLPHDRNPQNVLFMPAEWYVVDSIAHLRDFLAEEPWYRFPFMGELKSIWSLFFMSCRASYETHGLKATITNEIFSSNLMACVFTSYVYVQVSIFAVLLRQILGSEYADSNVMTVAYTRSNSKYDVQQATVDRYLAFSDFLFETANTKQREGDTQPVTFTQINGHRCQELMIKVDFLYEPIQDDSSSAPTKSKSKKANTRPITLPSLGVPLLGSIEVPAFVSSEIAYTRAMYRVPIPQLGEFLRACAQHADKIKGGKPFVYDF